MKPSSTRWRVSVGVALAVATAEASFNSRFTVASSLLAPTWPSASTMAARATSAAVGTGGATSPVPGATP
eukprot:5363508-Alexandrium_andersonii.AAC.1